jgi:hypothetical protein
MRSRSHQLAQDVDIYRMPPWIYPPAEFQPIDLIDYVPLPAVGATAVILTQQIEPGNNAVITGLANNFVGGGFVEGSGELYWTIALDGDPVAGYDHILASLGSPASPTTHPSGFRVFEGQTITMSVTNVSIVVAGQRVGGRLMGWYYSQEYENPDVSSV